MRRLMAILVALGICIAPASAQAFDTGPHADMTRDALTAEGFGAAGRERRHGQQLVRGLLHEPRRQPVLGARQRPRRLPPVQAQPRGLAAPVGRGSASNALRRREAPGADARPVEHGRRRQGVAAADVPHAEVGPVRGTAQRPLRRHVRARYLAAQRAGLLRAQQLGRGSASGGRARWPRGGLARVRRDPHVVRHPPGGPRAAHRQSRGLHGREGHPARARPLAVEQEQESHGGPQQGLERAPEVPTGLRDCVLRHASVDPRRPELAGQRAPMEARAVAAEHARAPARRDGRRGDLDLQRALAGRRRAVPPVQVRGPHAATPAASRVFASRSATSTTSGRPATGEPSTSTSARTGSIRPSRSACRTCPRPGRIRCSRAS